MVARRVNTPEPEVPKRRAATTPDGRENQLVNLAVDLAERQLRDGTASAQVLSHYLKAGSSREFLEKQRIQMDVKLMQAKQEQLENMAKMDVLYTNAIAAMRGYQGDIQPEEPHDA